MNSSLWSPVLRCATGEQDPISTVGAPTQVPFLRFAVRDLDSKSHVCLLVQEKSSRKFYSVWTTFTCPSGTYAYRCLPFGLCNAPATFQRCMTAIFSNFCEKIVEVFMDDFSIYGTSFAIA